MPAIVSGFGCFPGVEYNPTSDIVRDLDGVEVIDEAIRVSVNGVDETLRKLVKFRKEYHLKGPIIHFGVNPSGRSIQLENFARNFADFGKFDVDGNLITNSEIVQNGPVVLSTRANTEWMVSNITEKKLLNISEDAGSYICNSLYYKSLYEFGNDTNVLFVHIPHFSNIPFQRQQKCCQQIIDNIISQ